MLVACAGSQQQQTRTGSGDPLTDSKATELFEEAKQLGLLGDFIRAEQYFVAAIAKGQPAAEVLPLLIEVCIQSSRYDSAISHAVPYLSRHPEDWRLRTVVATLRSAVGRKHEAMSELEQVLLDAPEAPNAHFLLGEILWEDPNGDHARARILLERYLELDPEGKYRPMANTILRAGATESPATQPSQPTPVSEPASETPTEGSAP